MKILLFEWNAFMQRDLEEALSGFPVEVKYLSYEFEDWNQDEFFYDRFSKMLKNENYDVVFSLNFFPVVSEVCNVCNIMYISWVYDSPMHIRRTESLMNSCNRIFVFDRGQCESLIKKGVKNVYHMPLAVNSSRLERMDLSDNSGLFDGEISFVGRIYKTDFDYLKDPLDEEYQHCLEDIVSLQRKTWKKFIIDEMIDDKFIEALNKRYDVVFGRKDYNVKKEELVYAMATHVTRLERLDVLKSLSAKYDTKIYTYDDTNMIQGIDNRGSVKYYSQMPKVFANSKINLNISLAIIKTGIPLRVLDVLGTGGFLITNYKEEIEENFINGKEVIIYKSIEELEEQVNYYIHHENERRKIAIQGHEKVKKAFQFHDQLVKIFNVCGLKL